MYMRALAAGVALIALNASSPAQAGGFFSKLFGRAAVRGTSAAAVGSAAPSTSVNSASNGAETKPTKVYDADTLTVDQLASCLQSSSELDRDKQALTAQRATYETKKGDLQYDKAKLAAEESKLEKKKTKKLVAAYNAKVEEFNKNVKELESYRVSFNNSVDTVDSKSASYNSKCAKSYYKDDLVAAKTKTGITLADGSLQLGAAR